MENDLFLNAAVAPPMHAWTPLASAMEVQIQAHQSADCFFDWDKSTEQSLQFDSALSSMVSSPEASNSNDSFVIRELIGKLGSIGNSGEISPHTQQLLASSYSSNSTNTSCYSTPLNSPPKLNLPAVDETTPLRSSLTDLSADPGFAERAARFSCFGSRSFNGRTSQFGNVSRNGNPYALNADPLVGDGKLPCVSSSTSASASIKAVGSTQRPPWQVANSQDQSAVSDADPSGDAGLKAATESGSRKRKAALKGKAKETPPTPATKACEGKEEAKAKRIKSSEGNNKGDENECAKAEEEDVKQNKINNSKPPEPPKDYIHVRARRGQATDSHSLAERVRREKISERMKLLQDLVPGCNKVTGKALMLDEIINYVQSLQRQVEFLSMKFASVNTRLDFNADSLISKDMLQQNSSLPHQMFPLDSSASAFFGHQPHQNPALHSNLSTGTNNHSSVGHPFIHLPPPQHFTANLPQTFYEGDLQTIVQMGFGQNQNPDPALQSQTHSSHGSNQVPHMKAEL